MKIEFDDTVVAIPTAGGVLADTPLSGQSRRRFPDEVCLPVTKEAAKGGVWMVVEYEGRGVAMAPNEARCLGLAEAQNWIPDLTGVSCVPDIGEIEAFLSSQS